jgi:hypothetical protein
MENTESHELFGVYGKVKERLMVEYRFHRTQERIKEDKA